MINMNEQKKVNKILKVMTLKKELRKLIKNDTGIIFIGIDDDTQIFEYFGDENKMKETIERMFNNTPELAKIMMDVLLDQNNVLDEEGNVETLAKYVPEPKKDRDVMYL